MANSNRRALHAERTRLPPWRRSIGSPLSYVSTSRRRAASALQACPTPPAKGRNKTDSQINQRRRSHPPQPGRDQSVQVVAINRNQWSQSPGTRKPRLSTESVLGSKPQEATIARWLHSISSGRLPLSSFRPIFGSRALLMPRPDSDLDLFIDYDPEAKVPNMFRLMQIEEERGLSASR
jgi:hypothetical protein